MTKFYEAGRSPGTFWDERLAQHEDAAQRPAAGAVAAGPECHSREGGTAAKPELPRNSSGGHGRIPATHNQVRLEPGLPSNSSFLKLNPERHVIDGDLMLAYAQLQLRHKKAGCPTSLFVTTGQSNFPFSVPELTQTVVLDYDDNELSQAKSLHEMVEPLLTYIKAREGEGAARLPTLPMTDIENLIASTLAGEDERETVSPRAPVVLEFDHEMEATRPSALAIEAELERFPPRLYASLRKHDGTEAIPFDKYFLLRCCLFLETGEELHNTVTQALSYFHVTSEYLKALDFKNPSYWLQGEGNNFSSKTVDFLEVDKLTTIFSEPGFKDKKIIWNMSNIPSYMTKKITILSGPQDEQTRKIKDIEKFTKEMFHFIDGHPNIDYIVRIDNTYEAGQATVREYLNRHFVLGLAADDSDQVQSRCMTGVQLKRVLYANYTSLIVCQQGLEINDNSSVCAAIIDGYDEWVAKMDELSGADFAKTLTGRDRSDSRRGACIIL